MTTIKKYYLPTLLIVFFIGLSLSVFPPKSVFAAPGGNPTITITSPIQDESFKNVNVIFSGTYSDENVSSSNITLTAYEGDIDPDKKISDSINNPEEWSISDNESNGQGYWTLTKSFVGSHTIIIEIKETVSPGLSNQASVNFSIQNISPHGKYIITSSAPEERTYLCANCHSTHNGADANTLEGGSYPKLSKDSSTSYCMACHDGTAADPIDNYDSKIESKHDTEMMTDHQTRSGSCTACHNPHEEVTAENPYILKDHYVYQKDGYDIDSIETNCDSCHQEGSETGPSDYHKTADHQIFSYQKSPNVVGQFSNFSLCLRCHKAGKATDIQSLYQRDEPNSGHFLTATDGSPLNGHLPCAECHETHGSANSFLLKNNFGHENKDPTSFAITDGIANWTAEKEGEFCKKCHNGSTKTFGITGQFDALLPEHQDPTKYCSACHDDDGVNDVNTDRESFIQAAHAPKRLSAPTGTQSLMISGKDLQSSGNTSSNSENSGSTFETSDSSIVPTDPKP
jgi:predicted CXXCH cytochrome family protein